MQVLDTARTVNMVVAGTAVKAGDPVKRITNGITFCDDGNTMFGIAISGGAVGETIAVWRGPGTFKTTIRSGVTLDIGEEAYIAANGEVDSGSTGNRSCGIIVDFDPATAGSVHIDFDPFATFTHA